MADIELLGVEGRWWRQVPAGRNPLARPPILADGRWQRGQEVDAIYLADSPETAWAEWYRWLAEAGLPPRVGLPRDLWPIDVALPETADLRSDGALRSVGLWRPHPDQREWPVFQAVGERIAAEGRSGLQAPSAARAEGRVLCVFWTPRPGVVVDPAGPPESVVEPPVPPRGLRT